MPLELATVEPTQVEQFQREGATLADQARSLVVKTADDRNRAAEFRKQLYDADKKIVGTFKESKDAANKAHKSITALEKKCRAPIQEAIQIIDRKNSDSLLAEQREAEAERRRLEIEVRKKAEEEAIQRAIEAEDRGDNALADEILKAPVAPEPVEIPAAKPQKVEGLASGRVWDFEITNEAEIPRELCSPDPKKIRERVRALGNAAQIPGVRVFEKFQFRNRG